MVVGMFLYFVKHSCPNISYYDKELSKLADGATESHFKEMKFSMKIWVYFFSQNIILMVFVWNENQIPTTPDIRIQESVSMVTFWTFAAPIACKMVKASLCHQLRQKIKQHLRLLKRIFL
jgi:hypothetical protein